MPMFKKWICLVGIMAFGSSQAASAQYCSMERSNILAQQRILDQDMQTMNSKIRSLNSLMSQINMAKSSYSPNVYYTNSLITQYNNQLDSLKRAERDHNWKLSMLNQKINSYNYTCAS